MDILRNKKILAGLIIIVVVIGGGGFFLSSRGGNGEDLDSISEDVEIKELSPKDIGLTITALGPQDLEMEITKLDGIASIEYEASYEREYRDEQTRELGTRQDGAYGSPIEVKPGDSKITRKIYLGTQSGTNKTPHKLVSDIKFVIRVNFTNGEIGAVEMTVPNPQGSED